MSSSSALRERGRARLQRDLQARVWQPRVGKLLGAHGDWTRVPPVRTAATRGVRPGAFASALRRGAGEGGLAPTPKGDRSAARLQQARPAKRRHAQEPTTGGLGDRQWAPKSLPREPRSPRSQLPGSCVPGPAPAAFSGPALAPRAPPGRTARAGGSHTWARLTAVSGEGPGDWMTGPDGRS